MTPTPAEKAFDEDWLNSFNQWWDIVKHVPSLRLEDAYRAAFHAATERAVKIANIYGNDINSDFVSRDSVIADSMCEAARIVAAAIHQQDGDDTV